MSDPQPSQGPWLTRTPVAGAMAPKLPLLVTMSLVLFVLFSLAGFHKRSKYPLANPPKWFQPRFMAQIEFIQKNGRDIFEQSKKKFAGTPFRLITEWGEVLILPTSFAQEIRNEESLSFGKTVEMDMHAGPGFEPFGMLNHDGQIAQKVIRKQLTKTLNIVTEPLSSEATFACNLIFGNSTDWKEVVIKDATLEFVARLSSRVFLGEELCRNDAWLKITKEYTIDAFKAALKMSLVPSFLKPFARLLSADCRLVRGELNQACAILAPIIKKRKALKAQALATGKPIPVFNDVIDWAETESDGHDYDPAVLQLLLSFAAIHTTSDLTVQAMLMLANNPEQIKPLREEMITVLRAEGWKKSALYNMKLLDSAIKEAQRTKPTSFLSMRRLARKDLRLPDGGIIHKGERLFVDNSAMLSPEVHSHPEKFDIYRFLRMREEPGLANKAQLVSTSPEHLAFGHGMHACPGRFFAANEIKLALCHLLLKYDWKLAPGTSVKPMCRGLMMSVNPESKLLFRRRKEELDLESLDFA